MSFVPCHYSRFPVVSPVTYEHWFREGEGIIWNLSPTGWRLSGTLPLQLGDVCSFRVNCRHANRSRWQGELRDG